MGRRKKDGKRAKGIYGQHGALYVVMNTSVIENGLKKNKRIWISTGLSDTTENIKQASDIRYNLLNKHKQPHENIDTLVPELANEYLQVKEREIQNTSYASYIYRIKHIREYFSEVKVRDITKQHVEAFLDYLFTEKHLQKRSVKDIKVSFSSIMDMAIEKGIITRNPVTETTINKRLAAQYSKPKTMDDDFFSYDEACLFLKYAEANPLYELYYFTLFFGLRREEILGLRWSAINLSSGTLTINHTVTKGTEVRRLNSAKTASSLREYPLSPEQIELLKNMKKAESENRKLFGNAYHDNDYLFKHEDGSLFYPDYPSKHFKKIILEHPDLPQNITFHGLRKSCVSILIHSGFDVKSIQKWVGHADVDTTLRIYAKVKDKESKKEISDNMSMMIRPARNTAADKQ